MYIYIYITREKNNNAMTDMVITLQHMKWIQIPEKTFSIPQLIDISFYNNKELGNMRKFQDDTYLTLCCIAWPRSNFLPEFRF